MLKSPPAVQETWVRSLGQDDPLEKGMVAHSSVLAWRIPWTEEPGGLQSTGSRESDTAECLEQCKPGKAVFLRLGALGVLGR